MIKLDLEKLLFPMSFLELKYKHIGLKTMEKLNKDYNEGKLSFLDLDINNDTQKIKDFVNDKKDDFEDIVILGIGGSTLGTRVIMTALKGKYYNQLSREKRGGFPRLHILDNIDPQEIQNLTDLIELKTTLFLVISKSGNTLETTAQYQFFQRLISEENLDYKNHFVIIAGETSSFKEEQVNKGLIVFDIPNPVGGRFSVFTNVGLLPLAFVGIDIDKLLLGIRNTKQEVLIKDFYKNQALLTSIIQYHSYIELKKNITVFFPYSSNLVFLSEWYKQMIGESLGKSGVGVTLTSSVGVTDQHSQLQLYYDGPNDKLVIFLEVEDFGVDYNICCHPNFTFVKLMQTEKYGTQESISSYGKINYTIKMSNISEESIASLIVFFEMQTVMLGDFYGFNPFDQPGVEIGKLITKKKIQENIGILNMLEHKNFSIDKNIKITTIGGGNGQSHILKNIYKHIDRVDLTAIVSMSDDGRTTGFLIRQMKETFGLHMPPPGDLRRCLFAVSSSEFKSDFEYFSEALLNFEGKIKDFSIKQMLAKLGAKDDFIELFREIYDFKIELNYDIKDHKFGNILFAILYYNLDKDYTKALDFISKIFKTKADILPVTTDKTFMEAILEDGTIIQTQDQISNVVNYNSRIADIRLMQDSIDSKLNPKIEKVILESDYIIIGPGDLYTSILANFIIPGFKEVFIKSKAKIVYVLNSTNKKGETTDFDAFDFIDRTSKFIGRDIDIVIGNEKIKDLTTEEMELFKKDISVKGGNYVLLHKNIKEKILSTYPRIEFMTGDFLDTNEFYRYKKDML